MRFLNTPVTDLTYNDVFLVPSASHIDSRFDVDLSTTDPTGSTTPLVAANMTAVTGKHMVEVMARRGGLGIFPQDIPVQTVARDTAWIKNRSPHYESVQCMSGADTVGDVAGPIRRYAHQCVVVTDAQNQCVGVVRESDCRGVDAATPLSEVMCRDFAAYSAAELCQHRGDESGRWQQQHYRMMAEISSELRAGQGGAAPVLDQQGNVVGVISEQGAVRSTIYAPHIDSTGALQVGAAIGINGDVAGKARQLIQAGVDVLVVDTAHGHQRKMLDALEAVRKVAPDCPLVAGNVVTADGVRDLVAAGADIVKVGVGPGAMCTTRMMTAVGRPQFSAVVECAAAAAKLGAYVWADGGIKYPRDVALALAAGASQVMIGSWFAGTWEGAGELVQDSDGQAYKESFGMASTRAVLGRTQGEGAFERARKAIFEEGISSSTMYIDPRRPSVEDVIDQITAGVRSSMAYAGAGDLSQFCERAVVGVQNSSGYEEGQARSQKWV